MKKRTKKLLFSDGSATARAKVFCCFFSKKQRFLPLLCLVLTAQTVIPDLPVIALEADPGGVCPLGIEPYDAWCVGLGGGLTQTDGTPLPVDALRLPVAGILGRTVVGADHAALGRIVNVLVDAHGQALAVVIDFGGFMGVGSRTVAVEWALLSFPPPGSEDDIVLGLDEAAITATPAYDGSDEAIVVAPSPAGPVAAKPVQAAAKTAPSGPAVAAPGAAAPAVGEAAPLGVAPPGVVPPGVAPPGVVPPGAAPDVAPPQSSRPPPVLPPPGDAGSTSKVGAGKGGAGS